MDDTSGKPATPQQSLIINDLARNTTRYRPATCYSFLALITIMANFDHLCRAGLPMSGWAGVNRAGTAAKGRACLKPPTTRPGPMPSTMNRPEPFY